MMHPSPVPRRARRAALGAAVASVLVLPPAPGGAISIPERTLRISVTPAGQDASGASRDPVLSTDGRTLVFQTAAPDVAPDDLNGPVGDLVAVDLVSGTRRLVTEAPGGADGPSLEPAVSGDGRRIAFTSYATNLVAGDANGQPDVFVRDGRGQIVLVSAGRGGAPADGPSYQPDISSDGRMVVFTSEATNLVAAQDLNGRPDVFVRDLATGTTELVSRTPTGLAAAGRSSQPAISGDGRHVAFESGADDLAARDTNGVADVFVRDLREDDTERVSVSSSGVQQDRAVSLPFRMAPDISRDGRYVVFESDARRLAPDGNQRTDVFLRDRLRDRTRIVSASSVNVQGDNDSFNPRISTGGRYVAFQSFASNLVSGDDGPREDMFVRDLRTGTTTVATVPSRGGTRAAAPDQFLQRPALSNDAKLVAFASTVRNLVAGDGNGVADVFVRRLDPPATRIVRRPTRTRKSLAVAADDAQAKRFVCRIGRGQPFACGSAIRLNRRPGRLTVRAGGPGLLFDPAGVALQVTGDRRRPAVRVTRPRGSSVRTIRGRASDRGGSGLSRVEVGVVFFAKDARCRVLTTRGFVRRSCTGHRTFVPATGKGSWRLRLPRAIRGPVVVYARAVDGAGNRSRTRTVSTLIG